MYHCKKVKMKSRSRWTEMSFLLICFYLSLILCQNSRYAEDKQDRVSKWDALHFSIIISVKVSYRAFFDKYSVKRTKVMLAYILRWLTLSMIQKRITWNEFQIYLDLFPSVKNIWLGKALLISRKYTTMLNISRHSAFLAIVR